MASEEGRDVVPAATGSRDAAHYDTAAVRRLLRDALSDSDLNELCMDRFSTVYEQISLGMSKSQKIHLLIEHCARYRTMPQLLDAVRELNPVAYGEYEVAVRPGPTRRPGDSGT